MSNFGTVTHNGQILALTEIAEARNNGTDGDIIYCASAIDQDGNMHLVTWETTLEWDAMNACYELGYGDPRHAAHNGYGSDDEIVAEVIEQFALDDDWSPCDPNDETLACEWGNPISVMPIDSDD